MSNKLNKPYNLVNRIASDNLSEDVLLDIRKSVKELIDEIDFYGSKIFLEEPESTAIKKNALLLGSEARNREIKYYMEQKATFDDSLNKEFKHGIGYNVRSYLNADFKIINLVIRNLKGKVKYTLSKEDIDKISFKNNLANELDKDINTSSKKKNKI